MESVKLNLFWGLGLGTAGSAVYFFFGESILHIFTNKPLVLEAALIVLVWTIIAPMINSICFIWDGIYIGATATSAMRNTMLVSTVLFFVPVYLIAKPFVGVHALWISMTAFMVVRGLSLTVLAPKAIFGKTSLKAIRNS